MSRMTFALLGLLIVALSAPVLFGRAMEAGASETVVMPFPAGQVVRIIQGYNGGTHQGRSYYGLDLVLAGGGTSGAEVISPIDGYVSWAFAPGTGNGCMGITFADNRYSITLCHVIFYRAYQRGESIARGQSLGTVGPPGTVGNNGTPHVHMELHRGSGARDPVPFSPPDGLRLEGVELPATGARNEHAFRAPIVSTNGGGGTEQATLAADIDESPASMAPEEGPAATVAAAQASPPAPIEEASAETEPAEAVDPPPSVESAKAVPARAAVVADTGSCLNVREQPSLDALKTGCLRDGTEVALTGEVAEAQNYGWRQIEDLGWAVAEYLKRTRAVVDGTGSCLNVREEPSVSAPVVGCLADDTSVALLEGPVEEADHTWYRIEKTESLSRGGWVVAAYLD